MLSRGKWEQMKASLQFGYSVYQLKGAELSAKKVICKCLDSGHNLKIKTMGLQFFISELMAFIKQL